MPDVLSLSDAFENKKSRLDLDLKVRMLNINYGNNLDLMEKCRILREYAEFVECAKKSISTERNRQEALNIAIDHCINHGILSEFLKKYRAEVLGMLLEEFDVDKYERTLKREGREEGMEVGEVGIERIALLTEKLLEQDRLNDLKRMTKDPKYRERLFQEFGM